MRNIFSSLIDNKIVMSIITFILLVSLFSNIFLFTELTRISNELERSTEHSIGEEANLEAESEALVFALEREIFQLEEKIELLSDELDVEILIDENLEIRNDITNLVEQFSHEYLNYDSDSLQTRSELFKPFLTDQFHTTLSDLNIDDIEFEHEEESETDMTTINYSVRVNQLESFVNETTIGKENIVVFVRAETETTIDDLSSLSERVILEVRLVNSDSGYKVNNLYYHTLN